MRIVVPSASPTSTLRSLLKSPTTIVTLMSVDVIAATGAPMPRATPAATASTREPIAVGASAAPSNARPGQVKAATNKM